MRKKTAATVRLAEKVPQAQVCHYLQQRYHFPPALCEALYQDWLMWASGSATGDEATPREEGQILYAAVDWQETAGKRLTDCHRVAVRLTLFDAENDPPYREQHGLTALKKKVLGRLAEEAVAQGGALTQEDLAALLQVDRRTIVTYLQELEGAGTVVRTRASFTDQGRRVSHKRNIIQQWLLGYTETEIASRTRHAVDSVERYLRDFLRVALLAQEHAGDPDYLRRVTGLSATLIAEYEHLLQEVAGDPRQQARLERQLAFHRFRQTSSGDGEEGEAKKGEEGEAKKGGARKEGTP